MSLIDVGVKCSLGTEPLHAAYDDVKTHQSWERSGPVARARSFRLFFKPVVRSQIRGRGIIFEAIVDKTSVSMRVALRAG